MLGPSCAFNLMSEIVFLNVALLFLLDAVKLQAVSTGLGYEP